MGLAGGATPAGAAMSSVTGNGLHHVIARLLHWASALIVLVILLALLWPASLANAAVIHRSLGLFLLVLIPLRLAWQLFPQAGSSAIENQTGIRLLAKRLVHSCLYGLLVTIPLMGWVYLSLKGQNIHFLGMKLPSLALPDREAAEQLIAIKRFAAYGLVILVAGHAAAALIHQLRSRERSGQSSSEFRPRQTPATEPSENHMSLDPGTSPNFLDQGARRGIGVRRLNRVPLLIAGMMLLLILGSVTYTYQMRLADMRRKAAEAEARPEAVNIPDLFSGAPIDGLIPAKPGTPPVPALLSPLTERPSKVSEQFPLRDEEWEKYRQEQERRAAAREQRQRQAVGAPTRIQIQTGAGRPADRAQTRGSEEEAARPSQTSASGQFAALYAAEARRQRRIANGEEEEFDLNRAAEKRAFLTDREPQGGAANYLSGGREAPVSPYEVKAGTVIPAIMIGGISSDLPGQIIGQVTQNIYDSATGRYLLIPQGSKLVGTYDNAITTGQERVLVAWTRVIYPDSSSIDLGKMPGTDQSGLAGFHDEVNDHFWKMFSSALLMSVFSAGLQISQGGQSAGAGGLDAQQSIAAGLGQQLGQLGQELARRNTRIQPTLEIRPGYQFTVMVTKDMVLRPWQRSVSQSASVKKAE